jgi:hypothetical protein
MFVVRSMLHNVSDNESRSQILLAVANYKKNLCQYDYGLWLHLHTPRRTCSVYTFALLNHYAVVNDPSEAWFQFVLEDWELLAKEKSQPEILNGFDQLIDKMKVFAQMMERFINEGLVEDAMTRFCDWFIPLFVQEQCHELENHLLDPKNLYRGFFYNFAAFFYQFASESLGEYFVEVLTERCAIEFKNELWVPTPQLVPGKDGTMTLDITFESNCSHI